MVEILLVLLLCAAIVGVTLWVHHFFEGEWLPADIFREWKLSRRDIRHFSDIWSADLAHSDIIVSLTTIPSRIESIDDTLKSLFDQSRKPARILLNVPAFSAREATAYVVPERLRNLAGLEIRDCEDWGPATKVIPALLSQAPGQEILVVDDDRIYPPSMIAELESARRRVPDAALALAGWNAPLDLTDRATSILANVAMRAPAPVRGTRLRSPKKIDIVLGVMGYLVQPRFFDLAEMTDFEHGPAALRYVDDVRTSALCRREKYVIPVSRLSFIPKRRWRFYKRTALANVNRGPGGDDFRNNTIAIRHYASRWMVARKMEIDVAQTPSGLT